MNYFISVYTGVLNIWGFRHNLSFLPFSQDYGPISPIPLMLCVNFIHKWRDLQFKVESEWQIYLRTFSWQFYLLSEFLLEVCWREVVQEIFLSYFCFNVWPGIWNMTLCLTSQHTTYKAIKKILICSFSLIINPS